MKQTDSVKEVMQWALKAANLRKFTKITAENIIEGLIRQKYGVAANALLRVGVVSELNEDWNFENPVDKAYSLTTGNVFFFSGTRG